APHFMFREMVSLDDVLAKAHVTPDVRVPDHAVGEHHEDGGQQPRGHDPAYAAVERCQRRLWIGKVDTGANTALIREGPVGLFRLLWRLFSRRHVWPLSPSENGMDSVLPLQQLDGFRTGRVRPGPR